MRLFSPVFIIAAACALFLPFFGSFLDHHFADRHQGHGHIYIGGQPFEHLHPFETIHGHSEVIVDSGGSDATESESGIIFLPPDEEGATWSSGFSLTPALLTILTALIIPPMLTLVLQVGQTAFRAFIPAPEPPPPRPAF